MIFEFLCYFFYIYNIMFIYFILKYLNLNAKQVLKNIYIKNK